LYASEDVLAASITEHIVSINISSISKFSIGTGIAIFCEINGDLAPDTSGSTHDKCDSLRGSHDEGPYGMLGVLKIMWRPKCNLL
jgi:hypothetical protein